MSHAIGFADRLKGQVMAGLSDAASLVVALDGKTVRGAKAGEERAPHLLAAMICGARPVLAQRGVEHKTNEITQVKPLLDEVGIAGALVTADALHVQSETARYLVEDKHADYLFTVVKDNQPGLFAALDALDGENTPILHTARDRGHGRDETRTVQVLPAPAGPVPLRRPGLPDRADRPRPARRPAPLSRRRARHHQPHHRARRHGRGHRGRRPATGTSRPCTTSVMPPCEKTPSGSAPEHPPSTDLAFMERRPGTRAPAHDRAPLRLCRGAT